MNYESVEQAVAALKKHQAVMAAYTHALGVMYLDATTAAPSDTWEGRGRTMEIMSQITYDLETKPENGELLSYLEAHLEELSPMERRQVEVMRKSYDQMHKVPAEEYVEYSVLVNEAENALVLAGVLLVHEGGLEVQTDIVVLVLFDMDRIFLSVAAKQNGKLLFAEIKAVIQNIRNRMSVDGDQKIAHLDSLSFGG